jgi:prepilin-type processing-associated H-X9-DG protein
LQPEFGQGGYADNGVLIIKRDDRSRIRMADVTDGASNTFLLGELSWRSAPDYERYPNGMYPTYWAKSTSSVSDAASSYCCRNVRYPLNSVPFDVVQYDSDGVPLDGDNLNDMSFGSMHPGGGNFLLADGSVRFVPNATDLSVLQAYATRAGGEVASLP